MPVKGVIYITKKKHIIYLGLENQRRYWGEAVNRGAVLWGTVVLNLLNPHLHFKLLHSEQHFMLISNFHT